LRKLSLFILFTTLLLATPNPPSDLEFEKSKITKNSVTLSWVDNSDDETGFKIYRDEELIYITKPNITTFKDTFLYADREYYYEVVATDDVILDDDQRRRADEIISVFENNTTKIQYDYAENIEDGRGVTAGRVGFTTETGDMLELIKRYTNSVADNRLKKYIDILEKNSTIDSNQTINDIISDWKYEANNSTLFIDIQDKFADEMYYYPAMKRAYDLNLTLPVSLLVFYDTNVQHGMDHEYIDGEFIAGLNDIIKDTEQKSSEIEWIDEFLGNRKYVLEHTSGWKDTTYRIIELWDILYENPDLDAFEMEVDDWGDQLYYIK
jgi:chitosanase